MILTVRGDSLGFRQARMHIGDPVEPLGIRQILASWLG
jgi:hypothetical protein